jgi:hypothetical protein
LDLIDNRRRRQRCRQPEIEHFDRAARPHFNGRWFQIAMDDALVMRRFKCLGDLPRDRHRLLDAHRRS